MRVLMISFVNPDVPSGVRYCYTQLAQSLNEEGYSVNIITPSAGPKWTHYILRIIFNVLSLFGSLGRFVGGEINNFFNLYFAILNKTNVDIIHANDTGSALVATIVTRGKVPVVLTCHFFDRPEQEVISRKNFKGWAARIVRKWYAYHYSKVKYYSTVSDHLLHMCRKLFPVSANGVRIYNSIDFNKIALSNPDNSFAEENRGKKIIMNIGYLDRRKNQRFLIEVAAELRKLRTDFLIVIVGEGEDDELLRRSIAEKGVEAFVKMTGPLKNVFPVLKCSDIYFHTSFDESFGRVIIEAIAARVPAFAFPVGGIPELLDEQTLLPLSSTKTQVAEYFHRLLENKEELGRIQKRQLLFALKNFENSVIVNEYKLLYNKILQDFYRTYEGHFVSEALSEREKEVV